ncbi:MAG: hypothetical protein WAN99_06380 [Methanoculleus sp.]
MDGILPAGEEDVEGDVDIMRSSTTELLLTRTEAGLCRWKVSTAA